ncbi:MAG: phosphoribosylanthranilate isomerase [Chloroflexota bacterium]|nr:phosphoribosylanthranilate isomerase [Chloroflexota bacterium]
MARIKICGITNKEDALAAIECGADALGFIFAPSPRQVTASTVKSIVSKLPPFVSKVGVFVNNDLEEVQKTVVECNLDLVQLHGDESPEYCAALLPKVVKVFTPESFPPGEELTLYNVTAYMIDKDKGDSAVENFTSLLWLARLVKSYGTVIVAGGLTPENVKQAIEIVDPYAVDVCSGIEAEPGKKDHEKLRSFIAAAKSLESL